MKLEDCSLRNAAILLDSLPAETSESLLAQLTGDHQAALRQAIQGLAEQPPTADERRVVVEQLTQNRSAKSAAHPSIVRGPQTEKRNEGPATTADLSASDRAPVTGRLPEDNSTFGRLVAHVRDETLWRLLQGEHPQTVAIVVARMSAARAAQFLAHLDVNQQVAVARRVAELEKADSDILEDIESELIKRLSRDPDVATDRLAGSAALRSILLAADGALRAEMVRNIARFDTRLATRLGLSIPAAANCPSRAVAPTPGVPSMAKFVDLQRLDRDRLQSILLQADIQILGLALVGVSPDFAEQLLKCLPDEAASRVRKAIAVVGPIRLSDIERAQWELIQLAQQWLASQQLTDRPDAPHISYSA